MLPHTPSSAFVKPENGQNIQMQNPLFALQPMLQTPTRPVPGGIPGIPGLGPSPSNPLQYPLSNEMMMFLQAQQMLQQPQQQDLLRAAQLQNIQYLLHQQQQQMQQQQMQQHAAHQSLQQKQQQERPPSHETKPPLAATPPAAPSLSQSLSQAMGLLGDMGSIPRDAPSMHHLRHKEDRDSGNESSSMSPPLSFGGSRSPSHSSRSNSFSMNTLLRPAELNALSAAAAVSAAAATPTPLPNLTTPMSTPTAPPAASRFPMNYSTPMMPNAVMSPATMAMTMQNMNINHLGHLRLDQYKNGQLYAPMPHLMPSSGPGRELCEVCNDNASGFHYGVMSCEGCKGFFRRTVQKDMKYRCHRENACRVDRTSRNRCQACRFQKCLERGMTKESVRLDRGSKKRKNGEDEKSYERNLIQENLVKTEEALHAYSAAFPENCMVQSLEDLVLRTTSFLKAVCAGADVNDDEISQIVSQTVKGVAILRAAFSSDPCSPIVVAPEDVKSAEDLRKSFPAAKHEELVLLTGVLCMSTNVAGSHPLYEQFSECLRMQLAKSNPTDVNLTFNSMMRVLPSSVFYSN